MKGGRGGGGERIGGRAAGNCLRLAADLPYLGGGGVWKLERAIGKWRAWPGAAPPVVGAPAGSMAVKVRGDGSELPGCARGPSKSKR